MPTNVLQNPDFTQHRCGPEEGFEGAGVVTWWVVTPAWAPTFCVGSPYSENIGFGPGGVVPPFVAFVAPGHIEVGIGSSTILDPNIGVGGLMYSGPGFDATPGDVWEIDFAAALSGPYNIGGGYTGNSIQQFFVRIGGVYLDNASGTYKVFALNLPRKDFVGRPPGGSPVQVSYAEQFQIPADWPLGRYQFAICTPGDPALATNLPNVNLQQGIVFEVYNPVLQLVAGGGGGPPPPPNSAGPATDTWVFVGLGASFPGNHPDYDALKADGIQGVLWADTDPNALAGMNSTRAAGLKAGVWTVAGNAQTAASFATQASNAVTSFTIGAQPPDILVMDAEVVAEGFNPSPGWTWCADVVTDYRALQPTQLSAVSSPPLLGFPAPYNYGAFTAGGFTIWPQSYGASIPANDIDPIVTINSVTANGVDPSLVKVVLPGDPWGADVQELGQHGIYSYSVFDAEIMLASGGGPPPTPPPPNNLNGLGGIEEIISSFPQPGFCPGSPFPNSNDGSPPGFVYPDAVSICWGEWIFRAPYASGFSAIGGPNLYEGGNLRIGTGVTGVSYDAGDCGFQSFLPSDPFDFFGPQAIGHASTITFNQGDARCGWHYFNIFPSYCIAIEPGASGFPIDIVIGMQHASAGPRISNPGCIIITPIDEQRGGVFRYNIPPPVGEFEPRPPIFVSDFGTRPNCGATLANADILTDGPHAGDYLWQVYPVNGARTPNNDTACEHYQIRLVNPPSGGLPADYLASNYTDPITTVDPFVLNDAWVTMPIGGLLVADIYIPTSPARCYTVEGRTNCGGVIGPSFFCTVCLPGVHSPILDTEHRAVT